MVRLFGLLDSAKALLRASPPKFAALQGGPQPFRADAAAPSSETSGSTWEESQPDYGAAITPPPVRPISGWSGEPGNEDEERVKGSASYLSILDRLHGELLPAQYLEIGVRHGTSLALSRGPATGVDPLPEINRELPATTRVVALTSDDFFAQSYDAQPDFCFIDGLHWFEFALRDFINVEQRAAPGAAVVFDDIFPNHPAQAERQRRTQVWTGDVWRLVGILRRYRPDLFLLPLDAAPAGLLLVAGLNPANRVLHDNYQSIVHATLDGPEPPGSVLDRHDAVDPAGEHFSRVLEALGSARLAGLAPQEISALLASVA
jgi:hypothetical protein